MGKPASDEEELGVDPAFVLPPEHRPNQLPPPNYNNTFNSLLSAAATQDIPVIDLSQNHTALQHHLLDQIRNACQDWGFFQIINHTLPLHLYDDVHVQAKKFFALPLQEKKKVQRTAACPLGFNDTELTKNVRDWKEVFEFVPRGSLELPLDLEGSGSKQVKVFENVWPHNFPEFRIACERWAAALRGLAFKLLELISQSLGLPATYFHDFFIKDTTFMKLNYYPRCPAPDLVLGVSRHKDSGGLSILMQDEVGGLEVKRNDGEWIRVVPRRDAFVVNIGCMIQVWTNDKYQSVEHRVVVNQHKERFSVPYFFNPGSDTDVEPVPDLVDIDHPPKYWSINWGKYLKQRKDGNFKNLGVENRQIYHYAREY
ncbi:hypothetical protein O6H91_20G077000 [Diphasiastrum complanatum]|uniref:Uncharacterized protein n=1 Tax=Diphasiastrum complanatum TaxID=34168 RepID=A0ACC2AS24_DIPCM|nr:hypothetical protein O6H91_20G077000 [Diphasiastrum complanatum]